jgi:hypothetical protein
MRMNHNLEKIPRKQRKQLIALLSEFDLTMEDVRVTNKYVITIANEAGQTGNISVSVSPSDQNYLYSVKKDIKRKMRDMATRQ